MYAYQQQPRREKVSQHTHAHLGHMFALSKWTRLTIKTRLWSSTNTHTAAHEGFPPDWRSLTYLTRREGLRSGSCHRARIDTSRDLLLRRCWCEGNAPDVRCRPRQEYLNDDHGRWSRNPNWQYRHDHHESRWSKERGSKWSSCWVMLNEYVYTSRGSPAV